MQTPFITADGAHFYFISSRPVAGKTVPDLDIWVMDKTAEGCSDPRNLGAPINSDRNEWYPNVTKDGTIYFGSEREGGKGGSDIYRAPFKDGKYLMPENLGDAINTKYGEFEPCVAPDETYMIFSAASRQDGKGQFDLFVSYHRESGWTKAINLSALNTEATEFSPRFSPDGTQLFFASTPNIFDKPFSKAMSYGDLTDKIRASRNGLGDIYRVPLSALRLEK